MEINAICDALQTKTPVGWLKPTRLHGVSGTKPTKKRGFHPPYGSLILAFFHCIFFCNQINAETASEIFYSECGNRSTYELNEISKLNENIYAIFNQPRHDDLRHYVIKDTISGECILKVNALRVYTPHSNFEPRWGAEYSFLDGKFINENYQTCIGTVVAELDINSICFATVSQAFVKVTASFFFETAPNGEKRYIIVHNGQYFTGGQYDDK